MPVTPSPPAPLLGRATPAQPLSAGGAAEPSAVAGGAAGASSVAGGAKETSPANGAVTESSAVPGAPAGSSSVAGVLEDASGSSPAVGGDRDAATTGSPFGSSGVTASFFDESGGRSSYVAGNGRYVDGPPNPEDIPFIVVPTTPGLAGRATGNKSTEFPPLAGNSGVTKAEWTPEPEGAARAEGAAHIGGTAHGTSGVASVEGAERETASAAHESGAAHDPAHAECAEHETAGVAYLERARLETAGTDYVEGAGEDPTQAAGAERAVGSLTPGNDDGVESFAPTTRMWAFLGLVTFLGAVLGAVISHQFSPGFTAVTLVQGAPARLDPGALTQEDDRYVQTEAAYAGLADSEITEALSTQLGRADVGAADVTVVPGTTILRFVGSGETSQLAADVANISAQTYVQAWRTRMSTALTESLAVIDAAAAESTTGLLVDQRTTLDTQLEAVQELQRIVQPASAQTAQATSNYAPGFILGALAGATLGLMALLWYRRRFFNPAGGGK
jgi:hypothetical protein